MMASMIQKEECGIVWDIPMESPQTRIKYHVQVAADTELEAVSYALKEFSYLVVDLNPKDFDFVEVDATKMGESHARHSEY